MRFYLIFLVAYLSWAYAVDVNPCIKTSDCGSCLRVNGQCAFCKDEDYTTDNPSRSRCDFLNNIKSQNCKDIMSFSGEIKDQTDDIFTDTLQIRPQTISLLLRPAQTKQFTLKIRPAVNFPVHLYYLMDMSRSMEDDLGKLRTLGTKIADEINKITTNYKLAFGTFVDKTVAPFIQTGKLKEPCKLEDKVTPCVETFGYKHVFDFNSQADLFQEAVTKQKISGNLDTPEGGFDALMQVAVCNKTLKWDPVELARRIVVYVTDASPHIAGDGRLGGILKPNDATCHLENNLYTQSNKMDYPSVSLLREQLEKNSIIPIMAVTEDVRAVYDKLAKEWSNLNPAIGTLKGDSSNIVDLIREKYSEIKRTVRPNSDAPSDIVVKFKANCAKTSPDRDACTEVEEGKEYDFDVSITATSCPEDWKKRRSFTINVPGFGKTKVDIDMKCECDCEAGKGEEKSDKCDKNGTYKCGICYCDEGRYGEKCDCDGNQEADDTKCLKDGTDKVCSGKGTCVCGKCSCDKRSNPGESISGKYCECNNFGCDRSDGKLCGGPDRGTCDCGICKCKEAYLGDGCGEINCTATAKNCLFNGEVCSNNGVCECDACICNKGYGGPHCEECVSCPSKCSKYKDCVLCVIWNEGDLVDENCASCDDLNIVEYNETTASCEYQDENNCWFHFDIVKDLNGNETIKVQKEKRCVYVVTTETPILAIVLGIIGGLILLALILLLLWKLIITAYDNYEYQKFMKENQNPNWANTNNPIYKPSQTNYQNPTYAGK